MISWHLKSKSSIPYVLDLISVYHELTVPVVGL